MIEIEEIMDEEDIDWYNKYCSIEDTVARLTKMLRTSFIFEPPSTRYFIDIEENDEGTLVIACIRDGMGNISLNAHKTRDCAGYMLIHTSGRSVEELKLFAEKIRARLDMESEFNCAQVNASSESGRTVACFYVGC